MAPYFSLEQVARIRDGARLLAMEAADQEEELGRFLNTTEQDLRTMQLALADPIELTQSALDAMSAALCALSVKSAATVRVARQLWLDSREHHLAAKRLVGDLGDRHALSATATPPHAVLVVDQYPASRQWLTGVLEDAGFMVRTAANGLEAVIAAHQLQPSVILMEIAMPVLDGVEAARLIKAIDELRSARVIAYTARTPLDRELHPDLFTAILQKPSPPDQIVAVVHRYANAAS